VTNNLGVRLFGVKLTKNALRGDLSVSRFTCPTWRQPSQVNQLHFDAERCAGSTLSALPGPLKSQYGRLSVVIPVESRTMRKQSHRPWNLDWLFHEHGS
jgi:hypothetical protein